MIRTVLSGPKLRSSARMPPRSSPMRLRSTRQGPATVLPSTTTQDPPVANVRDEEPVAPPNQPPSPEAPIETVEAVEEDPSSLGYSLVWTEEYRHLSRDGKYYPSYQDMAHANGAFHTENILKKLARYKGAVGSTPPSRRRRKTSPPVPLEKRRVSPRTRNEKPEYAGLDEEETVEERRPAKKRKTSYVPSPSLDTPALTPEQRQEVAKALGDGDELSLIRNVEDYLRRVEKVTKKNSKRIMRQVKKLASPQGIKYHRWGDQVSFLHGTAVTTSYDFHQLHEDAKAFELEHGADLGHGWLLTHPIQKLAKFQHHTYLVLQKKKKSESKKKSKV